MRACLVCSYAIGVLTTCRAEIWLEFWGKQRRTQKAWLGDEELGYIGRGMGRGIVPSPEKKWKWILRLNWRVMMNYERYFWRSFGEFALASALQIQVGLVAPWFVPLWLLITVSVAVAVCPNCASGCTWHSTNNRAECAQCNVGYMRDANNLNCISQSLHHHHHHHHHYSGGFRGRPDWGAVQLSLKLHLFVSCGLAVQQVVQQNPQQIYSLL